MGSAGDYIEYLKFARYGGIEQITLHELIAMSAKDGMLVARAEDSGCEGTYCEVAIWNEKTRRFERYAFYKFLGGEFAVPTPGTYCEATYCANLINESSCSLNVRRSEQAPIIHSMPTFDSYGDSQECQALVKIESIMARHLQADGSWTPLTAAEQRSILNEARSVTNSPKMRKETAA